MGFVITATNYRGMVYTFWVPAKLIGDAYKSFDLDWDVECSRLFSRRPKGVEYHIKDRL